MGKVNCEYREGLLLGQLCVFFDTVYMELLLETLSLESYEHTTYPCAFLCQIYQVGSALPPPKNHMTPPESFVLTWFPNYRN